MEHDDLQHIIEQHWGHPEYVLHFPDFTQTQNTVGPRNLSEEWVVLVSTRDSKT